MRPHPFLGHFSFRARGPKLKFHPKHANSQASFTLLASLLMRAVFCICCIFTLLAVSLLNQAAAPGNSAPSRNPDQTDKTKFQQGGGGGQGSKLGADFWEVVAMKHFSVKKKGFSVERGEAFSE